MKLREQLLKDGKITEIKRGRPSAQECAWGDEYIAAGMKFDNYPPVRETVVKKLPGGKKKTVTRTVVQAPEISATPDPIWADDVKVYCILPGDEEKEKETLLTKVGHAVVCVNKDCRKSITHCFCQLIGKTTTILVTDNKNHTHGILPVRLAQ